MKKEISVLFTWIILLGCVSAVLVSDQGTDVKNKTTGQLLELGNLTIRIYNASSGGNLIFDQTFTDVIANETETNRIGRIL